MSRLRNIPGARERIAESAFVAHEPEKNRGYWRGFFGNEKPLFAEIGMGKGKFLLDMAAAHPENNYIGIEMYSSVLLKAVQRAERDGREAEQSSAVRSGKNFCFVLLDAAAIETVFAPGEIDGIYLNFSDPWPKERHAHRRLTSDRFLARYEKILAPGGKLELKTDNRDLFAYSLEMLEERVWQMLACTWDLYRLANAGTEEAVRGWLLDGNIASEYEEKFAGRGNPICKLIAASPGRASDEETDGAGKTAKGFEGSVAGGSAV